MNLTNVLKGCLVGGAIGDAIGSRYESSKAITAVDWSALGYITDDTQLTLATCEAILEIGKVSPAAVAQKMLDWYNRGRLRGLGASTLKALRDLQVGAHWGLSGRSGEYAAGNGAAMRIAPLAFFLSPVTDRQLVRDICFITHKNDEACTGCMAMLHALTLVLAGDWYNNSEERLLDDITSLLPDTQVKDNLLQLQKQPGLSIPEAAALIGCGGHVAQSVPFAIYSATKIKTHSFKEVLSGIVCCGGDTDTNASMAGQIIGASLGWEALPPELVQSFMEIDESSHLLNIADKLGEKLR